LAVAARNDYCVALREDLAIVGWGGLLFETGQNLEIEPYVAEWQFDGDGHWVHRGPFTSIAAGLTPKGGTLHLLPHVLALNSDGRVFGWGGNTHGQRTAPEDVAFDAIAAGLNYSLGIERGTGKIRHWGFPGVPAPSPAIPPTPTPGARLADVPAGAFQSISAGTALASAIRRE